MVDSHKPLFDSHLPAVGKGRARMGAGGAAFTMYPATRPALPVLIAVPHAGRDYTEALVGEMREPQRVMNRLEDRFVDLVAYEAVRKVGASLLVAHAPRAMIDLNRACEDVDWSMISGSANKEQRQPRHSLANRRARSGLGLVPRRLLGHGEIWRGPLPQAELERRISAIHRPYHQALGQELARLRDEWGAALLIDLHSMPPLKTKGQSGTSTEFVIGDLFGASCDPRLASAGQNFLHSRRKFVTHNRPYSGGYVLNAHGLPRQGVHALQLEICRTTYLDRNLDQPSDNLVSIGRLVGEFVEILGQETARLGSAGFSALAAE